MGSLPSSPEQQQQQQGRRRRRRLPLVPLLLAAIAAGVYANTLTAQFTFDDSFAIVRGGRSRGGACVAACARACRGGRRLLLLAQRSLPGPPRP